MTWMSGRLILNLETIFALVILAFLPLPSGARAEKRRFAFGTADLWRMAAIVLLCIIVFWRAAHIYFLSDDFVLTDMAQKFGANYGVMFTHGGGDGFFRPLGYISLFWTWPWAGFDAVRWHAVGLALHIVNALLVYVLAGQIGLSRAGAWFASALFALHGAHPEAVVWIAGRFDVLATAFALLALVAFVRLWDRPSFLPGLAAGVAMVLGILTKESAYAVPLMMLVFAASRPGASWKRRIQFVAPFFILAACLFAYRWALQGGIGGYVTADGQPQIFSLSLVSIAKALVLRLPAVLFFPVDWAASASVWLVIAVFAYASAWILLALTWRERRVSLLLPLGFVVAAAIPPVQQLLIGADLEKARLLYLPSVGFCLLAAAAVELAAPKLRYAAGIAMLVFSVAALSHNLDVWQQVAAKSKTVCEAVASCSNPESVTGLPRSLDGVYFFANGLPECVRLMRSQHLDAPQHACSLRWDERTGDLRPAQ
jgi:hypothetical protein